jgi:hypothetical protein
MRKELRHQSHTRNRFNLFSFPNGPYSGDKLRRQASSRTRRVRLAQVLLDQTIIHDSQGSHAAGWVGIRITSPSPETRAVNICH